MRDDLFEKYIRNFVRIVTIILIFLFVLLVFLCMIVDYQKRRINDEFETRKNIVYSEKSDFMTRVRLNPDGTNVTASEADRIEYTYQDTVTASEGETLDYYLESKLPHITSKATYLTTYTFKDKMSKGITYGKNAVLAIYDSNDVIASTNVNNVDTSGAKAVWKTTDNMFTQAYDDKENTMTIAFTEAGLKEINTKYSDCYIAIYYTAIVNSDDSVVLGDKGNPNDVTLTWKRSDTREHIVKDKCIVYSFGLEIKNKFVQGIFRNHLVMEDSSEMQFTIKNKDNNFLVASGFNGVYYVTGKTKTKTEATRFIPNFQGNLVINGLKAEKYYITQEKTVRGYGLLQDVVCLNIVQTTAKIASGKVVTVKTTPAAAIIDNRRSSMNPYSDSNNAIISILVENRKEYSYHFFTYK